MHVGVPQQRLNHLRVRPSLNEEARQRMAQIVKAESDRFPFLEHARRNCRVELMRSSSSQFEVLVPRKLIRYGVVAVGQFPFTSLVTNSPLRDFIPVNAQAKDASPREFPLSSSSGPSSPVLDGDVARRRTGTSDAPASYQ